MSTANRTATEGLCPMGFDILATARRRVSNGEIDALKLAKLFDAHERNEAMGPEHRRTARIVASTLREDASVTA